MTLASSFADSHRIHAWRGISSDAAYWPVRHFAALQHFTALGAKADTWDRRVKPAGSVENGPEADLCTRPVPVAMRPSRFTSELEQNRWMIDN